MAVSALYWIIIASTGRADSEGLKDLAAKGWLFTIKNTESSSVRTSWNYWKLFDFSRTRWSAIATVAPGITSLVVIGVLNLPLYVPAVSLMLNQPDYSMNRELVGHSLSNILSGAVGSVPNLLVLSNTRLFTQAGGGRGGGIVVARVTLVLFFKLESLLPFIPAVAAAILIVFLGLELAIESIWISATEMLCSEWLVVVGTTLGSIFVGFLPGFAIGVGLNIVVSFLWSVRDSVCVSQIFTSSMLIDRTESELLNGSWEGRPKTRLHVCQSR